MIVESRRGQRNAWRFREDHLPIGGFGTIADLRSAYIEHGGEWDDNRFRWWRVLLTVRWGLGMAGHRAPRRLIPLDCHVGSAPDGETNSMLQLLR